PQESFFFLSRRRHTSFSRDWSSDVCSSDLTALVFPEMPMLSKLAGGQAQASAETLFADPGVRRFLQEKLRSLAARSTGSSNLIRRMILVDPPPSLEKGELTDKGSINQRAVLQNRAEV